MPLAVSHMGMVPGISVIIWSGLTAGFGLYLQSQCARYLEKGNASFFALSQLTYPNASVVFDAAIAVKCFGVGVSYLIIIGDLMPAVAQGLFGGEQNMLDRHFWITAFMLVIIPLSYLRRLDSLKYTSIAALVCIGYLVILIVYHFILGDTMVDRGPVRVIKWQGAVPALSSLPVTIFAFTCHQNVCSLFSLSLYTETNDADVFHPKRDQRQQPLQHDQRCAGEYRQCSFNLRPGGDHRLPLVWRQRGWQHRRNVPSRPWSHHRTSSNRHPGHVLLPVAMPPVPSLCRRRSPLAAQIRLCIIGRHREQHQR